MNAEEYSPDLLLENLRSHTHAAHIKLEMLPLSQMLVSEDLNRKTYVAYLHLMQRINEQIEAVIFPLVKNILNDLDERKKSVFISRDLKYLNETVNIYPASPFHFTDNFLNENFALGIIYVLEGSTLGGRMIMKNVFKTLGYTEESGCSYFAGYQSKTGMLWKNFLQVFLNFIHTKHQQSELIKGAEFAFNTIYNFMSEQTKHHAF